MSTRLDEWALWLGVLLFGFGGAGDLAVHLLPQPAVGWAEVMTGPEGAWAHAVTLAGMLVILVSSVARGLPWTDPEPAERRVMNK